MLSTYTFSYFGRRHVLLTRWEADHRRSTMEGWVRVSAFMTRVVLRQALSEDPARFKAYVLGSRLVGTGLDFHHSASAWEAYIDEHLVNEWMPSYLLFEQPWARISVNVPVVEPVDVAAPAPTEWIEIAFVNPAGEPVPNVSWTVEFSDSRVMRGTTGSNGLLRNANAPPGNARLTYRPNGLPSLQQMSPPGVHTVRQGQDIVSIAWAYGHADSNVVWDHAQNKAARDAHKSPMVLLPGTRLFIPAVDEKPESYATGQRHEVVIEPPLAKLDVAMIWVTGDPLADEPYSLSYTVNAETVLEEGLTTDGAGRIVHEGLPLSVTHVNVLFTRRGFARRLRLRHLDPVGTATAPNVGGIASRLNALGYPVRGGEENMASAVRQFQGEVEGRDEPTGELDDDTLERLVSEYGA